MGRRPKQSFLKEDIQLATGIWKDAQHHQFLDKCKWKLHTSHQSEWPSLGLLWWFSGRDSALPMQGAWVWSSTTSVVAQTVKCLPTMQETWVQSLGWEDLLQKEMATHSSIIAWKIPWMEEPGCYSPQGHEKLDTTEWFHFHWELDPACK